MSRPGRIGPAGNPRAQERQRQAEKVQESQRVADLKAVMALPAGRRLLIDIIEHQCGVSGSGYATSGNEAFILIGQRMVGVALREACKRVSPDDYKAMFLEAFEDAGKAKIRQDQAEAKAEAGDGTEDEDEV